MAITFPASPADGATYTNPTTGVQYIYNATDGVWKTHVWPTNTNYLQLTGGTLTGDLALGTNDLTAQDITSTTLTTTDLTTQDITSTTLTTTGGVTVGNGLTVSDGNVVMAAGHGIDFSADANAAGMTSELLDDYEEGTWNPVINVGTVDFSSSHYIKIGNIVHLSTLLQNFSNITSTTSILITGVPFPRRDGTQSVSAAFHRYVDIGTYTQLVALMGTAQIAFYAMNPGTGANYAELDYQHLTSTTNSQLRFCMTYVTD